MTNSSAAEREAFVKLGANFAIVGGLGYIISGAIHQALPSGPHQAVPHVAQRPEWYVIHLTAMLSVAMWPVTFAALVTGFTQAWSRVYGKLALGAMVIGLVLFIIEMALDGHVLKNVSDAWAAASGPAQEEQFLIARSAYAVLQGNFAVTLIWTTGIPFLLLGLALINDRTYPRWLGWMIILLAAVITVFGITYYLRLSLIPQLVGHVIPSFLMGIWLIIIGIFMRRTLRSQPKKE